MDVTFFEKQPYFDDTHLQGENISKDSYFFVDTADFFPIESVMSAPTTNGLRTNSETQHQIVVDVSQDPRPTLEQPKIVPSSDQSHKETYIRNRESDKIWKGVVYSKNQMKGKETSILSHGHDPEPRPNQQIESVSGKSSFPSNDQSNSSDLEIPIALRKSVRTCTKHPMSNFVSYKNLSSSLVAFTSQLSNVEIPKNVQEALKVPKWKEAVLEEMKALEKNNTWSVMTLPAGKTVVGCKWVFSVKYNSDGSLERYKARLVAKGFTQTYGVDYSETFAPVAKMNIVRVLLSIAVNQDWPLQQLDVKNVFLNGDLEEEVYMDSPPGFEEKFGSKVCKLKKSLYGLKQSPRAWFEKFTQSVKKQGYLQRQIDHTLFFKFSSDGKIAILIVYVDDIILTGDDVVEMNRLK